MDTVLYLATNEGLATVERSAGEWRLRARSLEGWSITCVAAGAGFVLAGARDGLHRSEDHGATWQPANGGLEIPHIRWLAFNPARDGWAFAGTEPAGIFISLDGGGSWRVCPEVAQLRERHRWSLPYSPESGCVRGFAFHGQRGYAAVEDGCVLVSIDSGKSWEVAAGSRGGADHYPQQPYIHSDVHSIAVHLDSPDLVAAPTGGGLFLSEDGGKTWENLYRCYCRAVWIDPADPDHLILGPADGVDRYGRIEETINGGLSWRIASIGMDTPWRNHMIERFVQAGDELLAVLSNGELISTRLGDLQWRRILPELGDITAIAMEA